MAYEFEDKCAVTRAISLAATNSVGLAFYVCMVLYGLGRHKYYLSDYSYKEFLKYDYLDWIQAFITLAISKISICLLLLRLSKFSKLKTVIYALLGFIIAVVFSILTDFVGAALPIFLLWNVKIKMQNKLAIWSLMGFGIM
ncbi:MAG: hypothetical protein Q9222_003394 [Ikaeria aurantiellina]